ncbi:ferritin-2, chloroplastic [Selaginella moellendorffii]|uniref:ferritin-2, chloroplastic n=1 Tax=Selaginella moellendorffii TaxID=88036 RepID=UPI000D1C8432|nr:ferritin-2, chloroplastic [Selaginella moellendorffii]|eukprot:XP_002964702.2 ferritin-2, chloroplastic [Selaginella moellendorffii]
MAPVAALRLHPGVLIHAAGAAAPSVKPGRGAFGAGERKCGRVFSQGRDSGNGYFRARAEIQSSESLTGVVFQPFAEVQEALSEVSLSKSVSLARQRFSQACEAAINDQINVEYNVSYIYHALFAYFDRDNVGLPGMAKYFKNASEEEREHAETLMKYQNLRGGRVKLQTILPPEMEFDNAEKGDALYAMELALALEKLTNEKLLALHRVASENDDPQMADFVESSFLTEQVESIKKISEYVSQLRRTGQGHGVYHFDLHLQNVDIEETV